MRRYLYRKIRHNTLKYMIICGLLISALPAGAGPVPRILLAGDSWSALMQAFDTYQIIFPEYAGCESYRSIGFRTAIVGMRASEYTDSAMLAKVAEELETYPTIDIVHLSLGGNDILYGTWRPDMSPAQQQAVFDSVTDHIETVIDFILAIRPDIRIGLCGYTFGDHEDDGITPAQANQAILALEETKLDMAQTKDRVYYIHNLGLMQYTYGIPEADPTIAPMTVPWPGDYPGYSPMPGGNTAYGAPEEALVDSDIHLTSEGYATVARRCMDEFYATWLAWPRVYEVQLLSADSAHAVFEVRFSEAVTGVDTTDFDPGITGGGKALAVESVTGDGDTRTVTVLLDGSPGTPHLDVLDDDSIIDADSNPLGGAGAGNGLFTHNGPFSYEDPVVPDADDFDAFLTFFEIATAPYAEILNGFSFAPDQCDANGGFLGIDPVQINGNGLLDSCEFALITACLRDAGLDFSATGGVSHAIAVEAWENNLTRIRSDLGGTDGLAISVLRGLDSIMAGFFILGDTLSSMLPTLLVAAASSYNEFPLDLIVPDPDNYILLPQYFGLDGDADGDGFSNAEEYAFFQPLGGRSLYVSAALSPDITPESQCSNSSGGFFNEGQPFCLSVPDPVNLSGGFEWFRNGLAVTDDSIISGSHWRDLHISSLRQIDAGVYECIYDNGARSFGPVTIEVRPLPLVSETGMALLATALMLLAIPLVRGGIHAPGRQEAPRH